MNRDPRWALSMNETAQHETPQLGIFWLVINAVMRELASAFVPGFHIRSFGAAFWGAIVLSLVNMLLKWQVMSPRQG